MRPIDADLLEPDAGFDDGEFWAYSKTQVDNAPTITPERKRGRWMPHENEYSEHYGDKCSVCGEWYVMPSGKTNFCPNCGADMRGEQEGVKDEPEMLHDLSAR